MSKFEVAPRTDDFRLERDLGTVVVTFTPDGRSYAFQVRDGELIAPEISAPVSTMGGYRDDEVLSMATELARLAISGSP